MAKSENKLAREAEGPGLFQIIFVVVLSLLLGAVLGAAHLVFKPVELKPVEKTKPGEKAKEPEDLPVLYRPVYFTAGSTSGGSDWQAKQQALLSGQPGAISLDEAELNAFIASHAPPPAAPAAAPAKPADKPKDAKAALDSFTPAGIDPGVINFRLHDGVLQAAMAGNFNALGLELAPLVQMSGSFVKGADGYVFQPTEFYLGSLPLHKFPGLPAWLLGHQLAAQSGVPPDLLAAWKKLGSIAVEGDTLRLTPP